MLFKPDLQLDRRKVSRVPVGRARVSTGEAKYKRNILVFDRKSCFKEVIFDRNYAAGFPFELIRRD